MMNTIGWNYGFIALWGLHILSVVAFFTGVIFLIVLASKTFTPAQLKGSAIWLMITGAIVCLITIAFIGRPWIGMSYWAADMNGGMQMQQMQMMGRMMEEMMEHDRGANGEEGEEHGDMMQMMRMMMRGNTGMMDDDMIDGGAGNSDAGTPQDEHHESSSSR